MHQKHYGVKTQDKNIDVHNICDKGLASRIYYNTLPEQQKTNTVVPCCPWGNMFQDPQWLPEMAGSTEPCVHYVFSRIYTFVMKFNL